MAKEKTAKKEPPKKAADAPEPKDLDTQIKEAEAELSTKPIQAERLVGTHNALATHLHIKGLFNSIYTGVVLGSLVASASGIIFGKVTFKERLALFPESAKNLYAAAEDLVTRLAQVEPRLLAALGLLVALVGVCWLKRKVWPLGYIITRLTMMVFWIGVAFWLLLVLGLGETQLRWPQF